MAMISVSGLGKEFVLHTQGGVRIPVFSDLDMDVNAGECVCLYGPSGSGKSTLLRSLYANYKPTTGFVRIAHRGQMVELGQSEPWRINEIRRYTLGYVSQFLRVIPRVPALEVVAEPAKLFGVPQEEALERARTLLTRLNIPERLWQLAPATFSGGEQQRVNIARGFCVDYPVLLLDEPTASLDAGNRQVVIALIHEAKARGAAIVGIFHDAEVRDAVSDRLFEVTTFQRSAA